MSDKRAHRQQFLISRKKGQSVILSLKNLVRPRSTGEANLGWRVSGALGSMLRSEEARRREGVPGQCPGTEGWTEGRSTARSC